MAAWLGLTPAQYSTGGKTTLLGISKRGNPYVRRLLIHGARSCVLHLDRTRDRLGAWIAQLQKRMHANKVAVAVANKIARIAWVILNRPGCYLREDCAKLRLTQIRSHVTLPEFAKPGIDDETVDRRSVSLTKKTGLAPAPFI